MGVPAENMPVNFLQGGALAAEASPSCAASASVALEPWRLWGPGVRPLATCCTNSTAAPEAAEVV